MSDRSTGPLDLEPIQGRAANAARWCTADPQPPHEPIEPPLEVRVHFDTDVPRLCDEIRQLRAQVDQLLAEREASSVGHRHERNAYIDDLHIRLDDLRAQVAQLSYDRRLLGFARYTLDGIAERGQEWSDIVRRDAADIAQRIVDEIGHPATDEPALGPHYREQIDQLRAQLNTEYSRGRRDGKGELVRSLQLADAINPGRRSGKTALHQQILDHIADAEQRGQEQAARTVLDIHREDPDSGRCVECVEWCDCDSPNTCTHGNVPYPCPTVRAIRAATPTPAGGEAGRTYWDGYEHALAHLIAYRAGRTGGRPAESAEDQASIDTAAETLDGAIDVLRHVLRERWIDAVAPAQQLRDLLGEGSPLTAMLAGLEAESRVLATARAWRARIDDTGPDRAAVWADAEDLALIEAVDALNAAVPPAEKPAGGTRVSVDGELMPVGGPVDGLLRSLGVLEEPREAAKEPTPVGRTIRSLCEGGPFDGDVPILRYDHGGETVPVPDPHLIMWRDGQQHTYRYDRAEERDDGPVWVYVPADPPAPASGGKETDG